MNKNYIRYTMERGSIFDQRGLVVSALKKPSDIKPEQYEHHFRPEDFKKVNVCIVDDKTGDRVTLESFLAKMPVPLFSFVEGYDWTPTVVIFGSDTIVIDFVGFCTPSSPLYLNDPEYADGPGHSLFYAGWFDHPEVQIGDKVFRPMFRKDGDKVFRPMFRKDGDIPDLTGDYEGADAIVSEYEKEALVREYFIYADKPIVVHQKLPL